jgi:hypothetical protein
MPGLRFCASANVAHLTPARGPDGTVSDPQRSMAATLLLSGCRIGIARDESEVLSCLDEWGIPRKHRVKVAA